MSKTETHAFQTEISQLLKMMIHALYSNKEIFLRELVSNASDALDKLRFESVSNDALTEGETELAIKVSFDKEARTITISDNGIGMTRDDVVANIGTIANSGTKKFLENMTGDQAKDSNLIGQFGVGFYSSFIVADEVTLITRYAGGKKTEATKWISKGEGEFTLETVEKETKGTEIILHLKDDMDEFLEEYRLKTIITTYSDHINFPIQMWKNEVDDEGKETGKKTLEQVNKATALWTQPKSELSAEDYNNFYTAISHDYEAPLKTIHNRVEGTLEYTSLLYLPKKAPFDLYDRDRRYGLKLYVKRVYIMDDAENLLPAYLRFVRGIIDSNDLPLNVSREILQSNKVVDKIRSASVKRILGSIEKMANKSDDQTDFNQFWDEFGNVIKEGLVEDFANKEKISKLLRFSTTHKDSTQAPRVSLTSYVDRMKEDQEAIYFITADTYAAASGSPHLEMFRKKGIEVLLLTEKIDEWLVSHLTDFEGKPLKSVTSADLKEFDEDEKDISEDDKKLREKLIEKVKKSLGEFVSDVQMTTRLTDSPACVVSASGDMSAHMAKMMEQMGQAIPQQKPVLELNPNHTLVKKLDGFSDDEKVKQWSLFLLEQAQLAEGDQLKNPAEFIKRMNTLLAEVV